MLASVEHPFLVSLQFAFQTPDHLCMCLDFIEGGNMFTDLMRGPYNHERTRHYAAQAAPAPPQGAPPPRRPNVTQQAI